MKTGLVIDNFAGGGGASTGIEAAIGRPIDYAINHDPQAIAMHKANHPHTYHYCEDVWDVDPREVAGGRIVDLMWASPDCKHFSRAKGGKPVDKNNRGLAWVATRYAATIKPKVIFLENVQEFREWGPLDENNIPISDKKGRTFQNWIKEFERLGYQVDYRNLVACDYGAPTSRLRLFLVARCDGQPVVWPEPTHGTEGLPYRTAAECIDWSIPCPSIFTRKKPLVENTMRRIARGLERFVFESGDPFIIHLTHQGSDKRVSDINKPLKTITAAHRGEQALVVPSFVLTNTTGNLPTGIDEPLKTITTKNHHYLVSPFVVKHYGGVTGIPVTEPFPTITSRGTQNQLVTAFLTRYFGQGTGRTVDSPAPTITPGGQGKTSLVISHLIKLWGTCRHGQDLREPMPTVTAGGYHLGEVRAFLIKYYGTATGQSLKEPAHTLTTKARLGLIVIAGDLYQIVDIGMRMLSPRELFLAQGFPRSYIIDPVYNGKPLIKTIQIKMCGNSVSPHPAEALVRANKILMKE